MNMRLLLPAWLILSFFLSLNAQTFTGTNIRPLDIPLEISLGLEIDEQGNEYITIGRLGDLFDEAEKKYNYIGRYLDCNGCQEQYPTIVFEIYGEYTFRGHSGSKSFSLKFNPTRETRQLGLKPLAILERDGKPLIASESFSSTFRANQGMLYIRLLELRTYVLNNQIQTDRRITRLGKIYKF